MIRAIFFDLDGTLIDRRRVWLRCVEGFVASHAQAFSPEMRAGILQFAAAEVGSPYLGRDLVAGFLAGSSSELGLSHSAIKADLAERLLRCIEPDPSVLRMLADLSAHYKTAILSNGSRRVQRAKITRAGLNGSVGRVFISGELAVRKPDPAIFRRVLDWAGVAADEALIVGDHPDDDIQGGQRAGLRTCSVGTRYLKWTVYSQCDFHIDHVLDLPGVLR